MKAIGIDLGTTNSAVTVYDDRRDMASIVANAESENLTPSVVGVRRRDGRDDLVSVGRTAVNWEERQPKDTVRSVKRLMGRDFADPIVATARDRLSYQIVPGSDEDPRAHVVLAGQTYSPSEVSSMILDKLRQDASRSLGEDVTHAVITVPAYFKDAQRAATRDAGERAGLVVKKIIDEPTAAAVAFGVELSKGDRRRILVYDLGGGTFDISILNTVKDAEGRSQFQVLAYTGDNWLGGDDFDLSIVELIVDAVRAQCGADPTGDKKFLVQAKKAAEAAKRTLSNQPEAEIVIPAAYQAPEGGPLVDVDMVLAVEDYERMIEPLVTRTMNLVREALGGQELSPDDITDVLLVGGSTLTPKVYRTVEGHFGKGKVRRTINPMECVALGAGILAGTLHGLECPSCQKVNDEAATTCVDCGTSLTNARSVGDTGIHEVTGVAVGIGAVKGSQRDVFVPIIPKATPYPLPQPMRASFQATDGRLIRVPVYEGDSPVASQNVEQGVAEFELPRQIAVNSRVDVDLNYSKDRTITVVISVPGTDMRKETSLRTDLVRAVAPERVFDDDEDTVSWREELGYAERNAQRFLSQYEQFIEPAQAMKIRRDLDQAQKALVMSDSAECRRMANLLQQYLFDSGVASQLYLAERAVEGAPPQVAKDINQAAALVQESYRQGKRDMAVEQTRVLRLLVATALEQSQVHEIVDAEDHGGMLRQE
ncbi:MAG TPA: Hsp70 family protein [Pseudonocardiaceae bacterium]|jgi:molecular chaperone DnaK (HSP70)|nr:Hsp70 family protein [Pseudonocardiaceae bacterium]